MGRRKMLDHLDQVEAAIRSLPREGAFGFAVSCSERQYPVYERASRGKDWGRSELMRSCLDDLWAWVTRGTPLPQNLLAGSSQMLFNDDHVQPSDWMAFDIANTFNDLVANALEGDVGVCHLPGQISLEIIDTFLSDSLDLPQGTETDSFVDKHELTLIEMELQNETILALARSIEEIGRIRTMSEARSILGSMWYSQ